MDVVLNIAILVGAFGLVLVKSTSRAFNVLFGVFMAGFGAWALVARRMPSRGLPDLVGIPAMVAGVVAVVGGVVLILRNPSRE